MRVWERDGGVCLRERVEERREGGRGRELEDKWESSAGSATTPHCQTKEGVQETHTYTHAHTHTRTVQTSCFQEHLQPELDVWTWCVFAWMHLDLSTNLWQCLRLQREHSWVFPLLFFLNKHYRATAQPVTPCCAAALVRMTAVNSLDCVWEPARVSVSVCVCVRCVNVYASGWVFPCWKLERCSAPWLW